jgi:hypothetical protein
MNRYEKESDMYPDVCQWHEQFLRSLFPNANIEVHDLSDTYLSQFLRTRNIGNLPSERVTWDIKVDIVGFIQHPNQMTSLSFVECKNVRLTLTHLSQLLGYSRIATPVLSLLVSPLGLSSTLASLLQVYQRLDVLEYYWERGRMSRRIMVAQWDITACNLNWQNVIGGSSIYRV